MRKILDKMFCNKKMCIFIPMVIFGIMYLLFVIFSKVDNKTETILTVPIISAFWFFGVFFVVLLQVKNTLCPEWFLNLFEFLTIVIFGIYAIFSIIQFIVSGFQVLNFGLCMGLLTYSAVSLAHSKRTKE